jgi:hypothetical protein
MSKTDHSRCIAEALSSLWNEAKTMDFLSYIRQVYGEDMNQLPRFRCLYIAETEDGDFAKGPMGGLVKVWGMVDDQGLREIRSPKIDWDGNSSFFPTPRLLFYWQDDRITISERLGRRLASRKRGRLKFAQDRVQLTELRMLD